MRITQYAIGILFASALVACSSTPKPVYQPGSPEEARHKKLEMTCIETGGTLYRWNKSNGYWVCVRTANTIKIEK